MVEYIDRTEAIMAVTRAKLPDHTSDGVPIANGKRSVTDCVRRIKSIPAADVQPVVRCKDCQYWQESRYGIIEMNACLRFDNPSEKDGFIFKANAEDFCSFAKRRVET